MFDMHMELETGTDNVRIDLSIVALLQLTSVITERIHPQELTNPDSVGEAALKDFITLVFNMNDELLKKEDVHDVKKALDQVNKILKKSKEE